MSQSISNSDPIFKSKNRNKQWLSHPTKNRSYWSIWWKQPSNFGTTSTLCENFMRNHWIIKKLGVIIFDVFWNFLIKLNVKEGITDGMIKNINI